VDSTNIGISVVNSDGQDNQQDVENEDKKIVYGKVIDDPLE
jgi:hypothetical protein